MIRFPCPHCGKRCKAPAGAAGRRAKCPRCNRTIQVPGPNIPLLPQMEEPGVCGQVAIRALGPNAPLSPADHRPQRDVLHELRPPETAPVPAAPLPQSKAVLIGECQEVTPSPSVPLAPLPQSKAVLISESREVIPSVLPVLKPLRGSGFTVSIYENEERFTTFSTPLGYERILNCVRRTSVGLGLKEADPECFNGNVTHRGALLTGCWLVVEVRRHNTDNRCKIHFDYTLRLEAGGTVIGAVALGLVAVPALAFGHTYCQASVQEIIRDAIHQLEQSLASGG